MTQLPEVNRREALGVATALSLFLGFAPNVAYAADTSLPTVPATIKKGTFKGINYELVTVQAAKSAKHLGRTPHTPTGKLDRTPPITYSLINGEDIYKKFPKDLYFAANTTNYGIFRGVQIQDGKIFQGFTGKGDPFLNNVPRGMYALGAKKDGTVKVYNYKDHTAEGMVAEGVENSLTFSVALTIEGELQYPDNNPIWGKNGYLNFISASTIIGADKNNRIMVLTSDGVSKVRGLSLNETAELAKEVGFHNSVVLDRGGSVQLYYKGSVVHPSSDISGKRALPDWGYIDGIDLYDEKTQKATGTVYRGKLKDGMTYEHVIIESKGLPGIIGKVYGGKIDGIVGEYTPDLTTTLKTPIEHYRDTPYPFMFNTSAGNSKGRIAGLQIQNSILLKDFDGVSSNNRGIAQIGFDRYGGAKVYNNLKGDTKETLLKDKVHTSFGFGPPLVVNGEAVKNSTDPIFGLWNYVSARQVVGVDKIGRVMILTIEGISKKKGLGIDETALFAKEKGFWQATMSDSGGSAQTILNGQVLHPSSDSSGARAIPDMGFINADIRETTDTVITSFDKISDFEEYFRANGGHQRFGSPKEAIWTSVDGGRIQNYTNRYCFYSNNADGVHSVFTAGAIGVYYAKKRWELGELGYPITDELPFKDSPWAMYQEFKNSKGSITSLVWSEQNGAFEMNRKGGIYARWIKDGGPEKYGTPTTNEFAIGKDGGIAQEFRKGRERTIIVWSPYGTGTRVLNRNGAIYYKWASMNFEGCPETDEMSEGGGGASATFRRPNGARNIIYWSESTSARAINRNGAFYYWIINNGGVGKLGYPTHDERLESDGYFHLRLSKGTHLKWSGARGVFRA